MSTEDNEALCAGRRSIDIAIVRSQFPDGTTSPTAHDFVVRHHAKILVIGHAFPHRVIIITLAHHSHLGGIAGYFACKHVHQQLHLVYLRAVVGTCKKEVAVVLTVGT